MSLEQILNFYAGNVLTADRSRLVHLSPRAQQVLKDSRARAVCAGCSQQISTRIEWKIRDGLTYHPSCAARSATASPTATPRPLAPTVIGTFEGVAVRLGEPCAIFDADGGVEHERFMLGAFDDTIAAGGQTLRLDHQTALRGRFVRIVEDGGALRFRFELYEGPLERRALDMVKAGAIRGCSIGFNSQHLRYVGTTIERTKVKLNEISLISKGAPAWYGTHVVAAER